MTCRSKEIQTLLPAYLEQSLDQESLAVVARHLTGCEDCALELTLLRAMASEAVPDPGEAFWAALPGRIFREVQAQEQLKASSWSPFGRGMFIIPRWAWASAAVFLIAAGVLLLDRPVPTDLARTALPENGSSSGDLLPAEPVDLAELNDSEIDTVDRWVTGELALLRDDLLDLLMNANDVSIDERLAELNEQELNRLSTKLDEYEEEG